MQLDSSSPCNHPVSEEKEVKCNHLSTKPPVYMLMTLGSLRVIEPKSKATIGAMSSFARQLQFHQSGSKCGVEIRSELKC